MNICGIIEQAPVRNEATSITWILCARAIVNSENIRTRKLARAAINNGFVPVTVHLYLTEVTDDQNPEERSRGMAAGMKILENCKYILIGNKYGVSDGMKAEMTLAALKGKVMLYEQDGKIYLVDSREETTGRQDNE